MSKKTNTTEGFNRLPIPADAEMSDRQREMVKQFKNFSLNGMRGPFRMMLRSPEAAERFQALGKYLRFNTGIDERLIELVVLVHARVWNDQYEWLLHAPRAVEAGLSETIIEALRQGCVPEKLSSDESAVFAYVLELELNRQVAESTFRNALTELGEQVVTDLVFMLGQYTSISMALAVLEEGADLDLLPVCNQPFADYFLSGT